MRAWLWTSCALAGCTAPPQPAETAPREAGPAVVGRASDPEPMRVLHTEWHDNGLKAVEGWLVGGRRHGTWRGWHDSGFQAWEGGYRDGLVDGLWTFWDKEGPKAFEMEFVADVLKRKRYYYQGGMDCIEYHYIDNLRDGPATHASGGTLKLAYYSNGQPIDDPWQAKTAEACGYRLKHSPEPEQRLEAARRLAAQQPFTEHSIRDLRLGLRDPDPRVVRECVTVLGMAGEDAAAAVPALQQLAESDDPQTAERARAALRQIEPR